MSAPEGLDTQRLQGLPKRYARGLKRVESGRLQTIHESRLKKQEIQTKDWFSHHRSSKKEATQTNSTNAPNNVTSDGYNVLGDLTGLTDANIHLTETLSPI